MADVNLSVNGSADQAQNAMITPNTSGYYLACYTTEPLSVAGTPAGEGAEQRQAIQFGSSSGGTQANTTALSWSATGGTYTAFAIFGGSGAGTIGGGTFIRGGTMSATIQPTSGQTVTAAIGAITFTCN